MKGSTINQRTLAAWHEAGHAVAVVMRGGSRLTSVALSDRHGEGITWHRSQAWDNAFIAYAGPWAEAQQQWGDRGLGGEDEDGLTFDDYVGGVLLTQPGDAAILRDANLEARGWGLPRELELRSEAVWKMELDRVWPAITDVAQALLAGDSVTHEQVETLVEGLWLA